VRTFQYMAEDVDIGSLESWANEKGSLGWEVVSVSLSAKDPMAFVFLKREVPEGVVMREPRDWDDKFRKVN
jgi:hypothetical protein